MIWNRKRLIIITLRLAEPRNFNTNNKFNKFLQNEKNSRNCFCIVPS